MKKVLLFILSVLLLTSCDCWDWDCGKSSRYGRCYYYTEGLSQPFLEEDLIGTWGCTDVMFGNYEVKEFVVSGKRLGEANVLLQEHRTVSRFNRTYKYILSGKYLRFQSKYPDEYGYMDGPYEFMIVAYLPGSLYLQDSRGRHEVRFYSACSGY